MEVSLLERHALNIADTHGCHTVILYGSRARGDATESSDVDVLCVRDTGPPARDARLIAGTYFDVFICSTSGIETPDSSLLKLRGGRVLRERDRLGAILLRRVQELHDRGPEPLSSDERTARILWGHKTLDRIRAGRGPDTDYRRMFLRVQALEDYFALRTAWFRGSREALAWLKQHDVNAYDAFAIAMRRAASDEDIAALVLSVYGAL